MDKRLVSLRRVLASERAALITADFAVLAKLGAQKEAILQDLDFPDFPEDDIRDTMRQMQQVQDMTRAALDGLRSAARDIENHVRVRNRLDSYGPDGGARLIETPARDFNRRA